MNFSFFYDLKYIYIYIQSTLHIVNNNFGETFQWRLTGIVSLYSEPLHILNKMLLQIVFNIWRVDCSSDVLSCPVLHELNWGNSKCRWNMNLLFGLLSRNWTSSSSLRSRTRSSSPSSSSLASTNWKKKSGSSMIHPVYYPCFCRISLSGGHDRLTNTQVEVPYGGHYSYAGCPYVRHKNKTRYNRHQVWKEWPPIGRGMVGHLEFGRPVLSSSHK